MLGVPSEIHDEAGLLVWRAAIDPGLAHDFAAETRAWLGETKPDGFSPDETYFRGVLADEAYYSGRFATAHILGKLGTTTADYGVGFAYRPPHATDGYHQDSSYDTVDVVYGDDGCAEDIAPFAASEKEARQGGIIVIHFSAGDVVRHVSTGLFRRGRNPTDAPQVSAAVGKLPAFEERFGQPSYPRVA